MDIKALEETIRTKLQTVEHPTFRRNLIDLGMFDGVEQDGEKIRLKLKSPDSDRKTQITLEATIRGLLKDDIPGSLKIRFETDESLVPQEETNKPRGVKNIIAVGSGKGGVGKSTVSVNLACTLAQKGQKVGLLDADIYGPSVGKLVGLEGKKPLQGDGERKIEPLQAHGVKVISFSFLLAPEQPVVWRGPMLGKALEQFLFEVQWDDLDYLTRLDMLHTWLARISEGKALSGSRQEIEGAIIALQARSKLKTDMPDDQPGTTTYGGVERSNLKRYAIHKLLERLRGFYRR